MAKRFTDTDKWKREWFYDLKPHAKLAWLYILDQCDHCGIWPRNFKLATEQLGFKLDHETLVDWFGAKVVPFDGDKYFIPSFFDFQYGQSKEGFKARQSAIATLSRLGLMDESGKCSEVSRSVPNTTEHLGKCPEQSMDCPSTSTSKSIGKSIKGGVGGNSLTPQHLANLWNEHRGPFSAIELLSEPRKDKARAQIAKHPNESHWLAVLARWKLSDFCIQKWKPTFDDWLNETKRISALEGKYDNRAEVPKPGAPAPIRHKPAEQIIAEIESNREQLSPEERAERAAKVRELMAQAGNLGQREGA